MWVSGLAVTQSEAGQEEHPICCALVPLAFTFFLRLYLCCLFCRRPPPTVSFFHHSILFPLGTCILISPTQHSLGPVCVCVCVCVSGYTWRSGHINSENTTKTTRFNKTLP